MNGILNEVYAEQSVEQGSLTKDVSSLHAGLEQWHEALPIHLKYDPFEVRPIELCTGRPASTPFLLAVSIPRSYELD